MAYITDKDSKSLEAEVMNVQLISLRFLGIIWRKLRHEVSVYNVYITTTFKKLCSGGGGGGDGLKYVSRGDC